MCFLIEIASGLVIPRNDEAERNDVYSMPANAFAASIDVVVGAQIKFQPVLRSSVFPAEGVIPETLSVEALCGYHLRRLGHMKTVPTRNSCHPRMLPD